MPKIATYVTVQCGQCQVSFTRRQSEIARGKHRFCSQKCANKAQVKQMKYDVAWLQENYTKLTYQQMADYYQVNLAAFKSTIGRLKSKGIQFGPRYKPPKPPKPVTVKAPKLPKEPRLRVRKPKPPKERSARHTMLKPEPVRLPNKKVNEAEMKYVKVDARTLIQVHKSIPDDIAIANWNKKREHATVNR